MKETHQDPNSTFIKFCSKNLNTTQTTKAFHGILISTGVQVKKKNKKKTELSKET